MGVVFGAIRSASRQGGGAPMLKYRSIAAWTAVVAVILLLTGFSIWQQ
jgi:hypothetical protein